MRKLLLHIGLHKTGTTSLQETLHRNRETLLQYGVYYPSYTGNFSRVFYSIFSRHGHELLINKQSGLNTAAKLRPSRQTARRELKNEFNEIEQELTIISGEGMTRLPLLEPAKLKQWLHRFFEEIQVVAYVRPPRSLLNSLIQQEVRMGAYLEDLLETPPVINYRERLEPYLEVFEDAVTFKPFAKEQLHQQSIVADLLQEAGADPELAEELPLRSSNQGLDWPATLYLSSINKTIPMYVNGKHNPKRQRKLISTARKLKGTKFTLPYEYLESVCQAQAEDIGWIEKELGQKLAPLDQQPDNAPPLEEFLQQRRDEALDVLSLGFHNLPGRPTKR